MIYYFDSCYTENPKPAPFGDCLHRFEGKIYRGHVAGFYENGRHRPEVKIAWDGAGPRDKLLNYSDPKLISYEDLTYLLAHPDYAQLWLVVASELSGTFLLVDAFNFYWQYRYLPGCTII